MSQNNGTAPYDVAILGAGIAGSILASVLAKQGVKTLLIDSSSHPRFAIGESTIPQTLVYLRTLAARYGVPELKLLSNLNDCAKYIGPTFGRKAHFGFMIHHPGQPQQPRECTLFNAPKLLAEAHHLFRQDSDAFAFYTAIRYGATARQNVRIEDIDFDGSGVTLGAADGTTFRARYLVDATGSRSLLADKLGVRDAEPRFKHHSRSLWTHMQGVPHTDALFPRSKADTPPKDWYEGTVHHMFERGWFWVIAFDNNPFSKSSLCSVGLTLDERLYPRDRDQHPADEFMEIASRYPDIERQYRGAVPVREWTSTDRIQWSSSATVGDRWTLLGHAAGFIDPLFSFGLSNTLSAMSALIPRLLKGLKDDDLSRERFEYVDRLQQAELDYNDKVVNGAYTAFTHQDLWSAVFRIWVWGTNAGTFRSRAALTEYQKTGDESVFDALEDGPHLGLPWSDHDGYAALFQFLDEHCDAVEAGQESADVAADALFDRLQASNFVPHPFGFSDRNVRFINPTPKMLAKTAKWAYRDADPVVRRLMLGNGREAIKLALKGDRIF
jgi:FADH2 O2-dependent halogenase